MSWKGRIFAMSHLLIVRQYPAAPCWVPQITHPVRFSRLSACPLPLDHQRQPIRLRLLPLLCSQRERRHLSSAAAGCPWWVTMMVRWAACMHGCSQCQSWHTPPLLSYNIQRNLEQALLNKKNISNNISVKLAANPKKKIKKNISIVHLICISCKLVQTPQGNSCSYDIPVSQKLQLAWTWVKSLKATVTHKNVPKTTQISHPCPDEMLQSRLFLHCFCFWLLASQIFSNYLTIKMCKIKGSGRFLWGKCDS